MIPPRARALVYATSVLMAIVGTVFAAGVHLGMPGAVKSKGKALDKEVRRKQWEKYGIVLGPNTVVLLDQTNREFVSTDGTTYHYTNRATEFNDLSPGTIIISTAGDGFLRRIVSVQEHTNEYIVMTTDSSIEEAFDSATIDIQRTLTTNDLDSRSTQFAQGLSLRPASNGQFNVVLNNFVLFDADDNTATNADQILANGTILFQPDINFSLHTRAFSVNRLRCSLTVNENANLQIKALVGTTFSNEFNIASFHFIPLVFPPPPAPPVLVLVPSVNLVVGYKGYAGLVATAGTVQQAAYTGGALYENGGWSRVNNFTNSFQLQAPSFSVAGGIKGYLGPKFSTQIYGVAGPYVSAAGYVKPAANLVNPSTLSWTITGGLEGSAGVEIKIFSLFKAGYQVSLFDYEKTIGTGNTVPPETVGASTQPSGPTTGTTGIFYNFTIGGATSDLGHAIEFRFNWGDGTYSPWLVGSTATVAHSWSSAGTYLITAEARCQIDTSVNSVSSALAVNLSSASETVSSPTTPAGPTSGLTNSVYTYSTGGSTSNLGHSTEYRFDWGNGSYSTWSTTGTASYAWTAAGSYNVRAEARCAIDTAVTTLLGTAVYDSATYDDHAFGLAVDSSENVVVVGFRKPSGGMWYWHVRKYDATLTTLLGSTDYDSPGLFANTGNSVAVDSGGNIVVAGINGKADWLVRKYDPTLTTLLGSTEYDGPASSTDFASSVAVDSAGNVVVVGTETGIATYRNWRIRKYAPTLTTLLGSTEYDGPANWYDSANSVAVDSSGNVVVVGTEGAYSGSGGYNWRVHKYGP